MAVRRTTDGAWIYETRTGSFRSDRRSERDYTSKQGAVRAAKKVASEKAWPLVILPDRTEE